MKWAILGSRGMLGSDLVEYLLSQGEEVLTLHRGNQRLTPDIALPPELSPDVDVVVNCAAFTKVDLAEESDQAELAYLVNSELPRRLAVGLNQFETRFIQISSDYVFDGTKGSAYLPDDPTNPVNVYGKSKAEGEEASLGANNKTQVIRTSWLYGSKRPCFPRRIGARLLAGEEIPVVSDQFGTPTHTLDLAEFIYRVGRSPIEHRILHGVSEGSTNWFNFANEVSARLPKRSGLIYATTTEEYPTAAKRPPNSTLQQSSIDNWRIDHWSHCWDRAAPRVLGHLD